jgi:hypothetical protein
VINTDSNRVSDCVFVRKLETQSDQNRDLVFLVRNSLFGWDFPTLTSRNSLPILRQNNETAAHRSKLNIQTADR